MTTTRHDRPVGTHSNGRRQTAPTDRLSAALAEQLATTRRRIAALEGACGHIAGWGAELRRRLQGGGRLLVAGNGGSAALAQHLAGELVGRYDRDRPSYSAIALTAETASLTAIGNDYGFDRCFSRQVEAHGRRGDIFLGLSTSGRSRNLIDAVAAARARGLVSWAMTGPVPNPLADASDEVLGVSSETTASIQDVHQVAVHLLCLAFELAEPSA